MKRIISLILVLLMTSPLIVSCSDATTDENEKENVSAESVGTESETEVETEDPWFGLEKSTLAV